MKTDFLTARVRSFLNVPFVRDVAKMQLGVLVTFACSFAASVLYVRLLGIDQYGRYAVVGAFAGLFSFITNLGQQQTTLTFFSEAYGAKDTRGMATALRYYAMMTGLMWILQVVLLFLYPLLAQMIYGDPSVGRLAQLIAIASIIDPVYNFLLLALQTVRRIALMTVLQNIQTVVQLVVAVALLAMGFGIAGILWSSIVGSVVLGIVALFYYPQLQRQYSLPGLSEAMAAGNDQRLWRYFLDGFWIAVDKNLSKQYPGLFIFVLSLTSPVSVVGLVRLAFRLAELPATFGLGSVSTLASSVIPQLSRTTQWRQSVRKLVTHSIALHFGLSLAAAIVIPPLIPLVYGEASRVAAVPFLVILAIHLTFALYVLITPILRLKFKVWMGVVVNALALAAAVGVFFSARLIMRDTFALYSALAVCHLISLALVFPVWRMTQEMASPHDRARDM